MCNDTLEPNHLTLIDSKDHLLLEDLTHIEPSDPKWKSIIAGGYGWFKRPNTQLSTPPLLIPIPLSRLWQTLEPLTPIIPIPQSRLRQPLEPLECLNTYALTSP